ncbi:MAG: hypothetical protein ACRD0K_09125 [Egibacteraceae bacterium]
MDRLVGLARVSGVVVIEDVDFGGAFCHPADPAVQRFGALHQQLIRRRGGDPEIGRRLPLMLQDAGLTRTGFEIVHRAFMRGAEGDDPLGFARDVEWMGPSLVRTVRGNPVVTRSSAVWPLPTLNPRQQRSQ